MKLDEIHHKHVNSSRNVSHCYILNDKHRTADNNAICGVLEKAVLHCCKWLQSSQMKEIMDL